MRKKKVNLEKDVHRNFLYDRTRMCRPKQSINSTYKFGAFFVVVAMQAPNYPNKNISFSKTIRPICGRRVIVNEESRPGKMLQHTSDWNASEAELNAVNQKSRLHSRIPTLRNSCIKNKTAVLRLPRHHIAVLYQN